MDFSGEDEGHVNAPVNPDLPEFLVIPPRLWVGKTISLYNGSGVCIAEGLVQNLRSNAIVGSPVPLAILKFLYKYLVRLLKKKHLMNGGTHLSLGRFSKSFLRGSVSFTTASATLTTFG